MKPRGDSIAILTHYGRKSGKAYRVQIWWVELDGQVWIGSLNTDRAWVRNVRATGRALLDRGRGEEPIRCERIDDPADLARFGAAVRSKYPILGRLLPLLFLRERCAFRTRPDRAATA
jgi:deazaflavin-dependent oxidoreductase (nitroreductase family)